MRRSALFASILLVVFAPLTVAIAANVNVNAVVPAKPSDFSVTMTTTDLTNPVGLEHSIPFSISYANNLAYATTVTVVASWSRGTIQGDADPSVNILHYLPSSATDGYAGTTPVIDTVNRTITWTIPSYPGNGQANQVSFSLESSSTYTNDLPVAFSVTSTLKGPGTTTHGSEVNRNYLVIPPDNNPTPTPTAGPTSTPMPAAVSSTPTAAPTLVPTITPAARADGELIVSSINIQTLQATAADIDAIFNLPVSTVTKFGTTKQSLSKSISNDTRARRQQVTLSGLLPDTVYYFQVIGQSADGQKVISDIFTFKTSKEDLEAAPVLSSLVITSHEIILSDKLDAKISETDEAKTPLIVIPIQALYEFRFSIANAKNIKSIEAFIRNKKVLAANTFDYIDDTEFVEIVETSPGVYIGRLRSPDQPGNYELYLRIYDAHGNIVESKISDIKVSRPFSVQANNGKTNVEGAEVTFYYWNSKTNKYEKIRSSTLAIDNPSYTNHKGGLDITLPKGRYKAIVKTLTYPTKEVEFVIGVNANDGYPQIMLGKSSLNVFNVLSYFSSSFINVFYNNTVSYLETLSSSVRMKHVTIIGILISLVLLTLLSASQRIQVPVFSFHRYLAYHFRKGKKKSAETTSLTGKITNHESGNALSGVNVYIISPDSNAMIAHGVTNRDGRFQISGIEKGSYRIEALTQGFQPFSIFESLPFSHELHLALTSHQEASSIKERVKRFSGFILSTSFEIVLFGSLFLMVAIGLKTQWLDVLPFMALALFNVYLWYLHHRNTTISLHSETKG